MIKHDGIDLIQKGNKAELVCLHCKEVRVIRNAMELNKISTISKIFSAAHADCKDKKNENKQ